MPDRTTSIARVLRAATLAVILVGVTTPGCRWGERFPVNTQKQELPEEIVRVKLFGPAPAVPLSINGPFTVFSFNGRTVLQKASLSPTDIRVEGNTLVIGSARVAIDDFCDFVPERNGTVSIDYRPYRGSIRVHRTADGQLLAVNHVRMEDYLKGVLPGELPNRFSPEAFKAQAIAARTFALYEKYTAPGRRKWDVGATEGSQMYLGHSAETPKSLDAVEKTRGIVLTAQVPGRGWRIFPTYYSSTCGGRTQAGVFLAKIDPGIRPLQGGVACPGCSISPHYRWTDKAIPAAEITQSINAKAVAAAPFQMVKAINILERAQNCRITKVEVVDVTGQRAVLTGERFRLVVGSRKMPSTWCNVRLEGGQFVFSEGHGLGHGVGMCQYGAEGLAERGYTAQEILLLYYPGAKLTRVY